MPGEAGWVLVLGVIVVGFCLLILTSKKLRWSPERREKIATGFTVALLVIVALYLFVAILPGLSQIGGW